MLLTNEQAGELIRLLKIERKDLEGCTFVELTPPTHWCELTAIELPKEK